MNARHDAKGNSTVEMLSLFVISLLPALNICLFGPATIFAANPEEFDSGYFSLVLPLISLAAALALLLTAVGFLLGRTLRPYYSSLIFAVGLLLWAQGSFLMYDYGVLDGRGIDWQGFDAAVSFDILLWLVVIALALAFARRVGHVAVFGSLVFIVLQILPVAPTLFGDQEEQDGEPLSGPPEDILQYSSSRNIVHVVLDNFQTDVFMELIEEAALEKEFDGFTLYRDNTAAAPHTSLAVPAIFSGRVFDGSEDSDVYYRRALEAGFHTELLEHGYRVNLIPMLSMRASPYSNYHEVPDLYSGTERDRLLRDSARLLDVSLFRQLPHKLRSWVYNENNWRVAQLVYAPDGSKGHQHRKFLLDYIDRIEVTQSAPTYHYLHFWPPHPPFTTTASGHSAGRVLPNTRENYRNEARPMVALLVDFVRKLQALGIYDESMIIFQSDHGGGFEPESIPRRALGLMAIKPFGSRGSLRTSDAPTSVTDIASTVMAEAGIEAHGFPGQSILSMDEGQRSRRFVSFHENGLRTIEINGSAYDPDSYSESRALQTLGDGRDYHYGDFVNVGLAGQGGRYLVSGWASPSHRHVLSDGNRASLALDVPAPANDLELLVELIPIVDEELHPRQRVTVRVNGHLALEWVGRERSKQQLEVRIPRKWVSGPQLDVSFELPDAASPAEVGFGGDRRNLAIALTGFSVQELE